MRALRRLRAALPTAAILAISAMGASTVQAAPGEWTSTYDWHDSPTTGFGGWGSFETYAVGPGGYYTAAQNGPLGLGLSMRPTGGRVYSNADPDSEVGGPKLVWQLNAPGTTRIRQGTFDHVDYAGTGERQFLRLALYGDDIEDTKYDYTPPDVNDDGPRVVTRPPFQPGAQNTQLWLYTSCPKDPPSAPAACPFVPNPSNSKGRVGKVVLELTDPEPPAINVTGPLASGGWSQGRGNGGARLAATDPGSGIENIRLTAAEPGRPPRLVSSQNAPCDPGHTQPKPAGREAAICPDSYTTDATDRPSQLREGETTYTATATDLAQRTGSRSFTVRIDRTPPTRLTGTGPLTRLVRKWTNTRATHTLIAGASDARSGIARMELRAGQTMLAAKDHPCANGSRLCPKRWSTPLAADLGRLREGRHRLTLRAIDLAGNTTTPRSVGELLIDRTTPTAPKGQVQVTTNGTTARWTSYDRGSRLDLFRVRVERAGRRDFVRAVRPAGGRQSTGRISQPGVKAASITVTAHDRAGNTAAARIRCKTGTARKNCGPVQRHRSKKKRRKRPKAVRSGSSKCSDALTTYRRKAKEFGGQVARYRKLVKREGPREKPALGRALELRAAAKAYEARARDDSKKAVALAKSYQRSLTRFENVRTPLERDRKAATLTSKQVLKLDNERGAAFKAAFKCGPRTRVKLTTPSALADRRLRQYRNARRTRRATDTYPQVDRVRRQALSARGRGLLKTTEAAALAYQPILHVDRSDGFWPVRFDAAYDYRREPETPAGGGNPPAGVPPPTIDNGFKQTCVKEKDKGGGCDSTSPRRLLAGPGRADLFLDYPAPSDDRDKQQEMLERATGGYAKQPAMYYFKTLGEPRRKGATSAALQYWFYYTFNYQTDNAGRHEGDFEHVAIVLSRYTGLPRYVFMARHDKDEAQRQTEPLRYYYRDLRNPKGLTYTGDHVKVWAAKGSHANYPRCGRWDRIEPGKEDFLLPDDYTCKDKGPVKTFGTDTRLLNLARTPWSCWRGRFGEKGPRGKIPTTDDRVDNDGPLSPLRQQDQYYAKAKPCDTGLANTRPIGARSSQAESNFPVGDSLNRGSEGSLDNELLDEASLSESTVTKSEQAGAIYDQYFDTCDDWQTPAAQQGTKLVACDQRLLDRYFDGGLEDPGSEALRIVDPSARPANAPAAVPPVFETDDPVQAARANITADAPVNPSVFAATTDPDGIVRTAMFRNVQVIPQRPLRLRARQSRWRLIDPQGRTVADARPRVSDQRPPAPARQVRARLRGRSLVVRWRVPSGRVAQRFMIYGTAGKKGRMRRLASVDGSPQRRSYRRRVRVSRRVTKVRVVAVTGRVRNAPPAVRVR